MSRGDVSSALARCSNCRGLWMPNRVSSDVIRGQLDAATKALLAESLRHRSKNPGGSECAVDQSAYRQIAVGGRSCPICRSELLVTRYLDVEIDVCGPHGAFFEARELVALVNQGLNRDDNVPPSSTNQSPMARLVAALVAMAQAFRGNLGNLH